MSGAVPLYGTKHVHTRADVCLGVAELRAALATDRTTRSGELLLPTIRRDQIN